jgi:SP family sugar:H+ symporter-like MFS transporter
LLMGYDVGAAAGVLIMESFVYDYCVDWHNYLREDCKAPIADQPRPWTTMMARYIAVHHVGTSVGVMLSTRMANRFGRRRTIFSAAVLYCIACGGAFYVPPHWRRLLLTVRAAQGLAMGVFSTALSLFASELAPFDHRRANVSTISHIFFAVGMVAASAANMLMERRIQGWRKTNAAASLIPLAVMFAVCFVPESPKWTYMRKGRAEAEKLLRRLRGTSDVQTELDNLSLDLDQAKDQSLELTGSPPDQAKHQSLELTGSPPAYKSMLVSLFTHVLQQATGISTVLAFGALIFKDVARAGLAVSLLLSIAYLIGSVSADHLSSLLGRRWLLLFGSISMAASHAIISAIYWALCDGGIDQPDDSQCSDAVGWLLSWTTAWFVFSFAATWGSEGGRTSALTNQVLQAVFNKKAAPTPANWFASAAAVQAGMALLPHAQLNDVSFVLAWLCGYAGLFVYVFCPEKIPSTSDDCQRFQSGQKRLSDCLEKRSRTLFKAV